MIAAPIRLFGSILHSSKRMNDKAPDRFFRPWPACFLNCMKENGRQLEGTY